MKITALGFAIICLFASLAVAQEDARPVWQVTNFDITANLQPAQRTLNAVAVLNATNVGRGAGSSFTFRLNQKATVQSVTVGGASATFRSVPETYGNLQRVTTTLPNSIAPDGKLVIQINYNFLVDSNTGLAALSPNASQFLPSSLWYPTPNTMFTSRGADTAPVRLVVNGTGVISSGMEKTGAAGTSVYEQPLNVQPFFVQGDWERIEGSNDGKNITAFLPRGSSAEDRKQAESIIAYTASARSYFASLLGAAPDVAIRLVSVRRGSGFGDGGTILLEPAAFRRQKLDSSTALVIAESISRLWLGGQSAIRGEGNGLLREGLPRFLATLFLEKQFGRDAAQEELQRERLAYNTVAKRDGPLARVTPQDPTYFNAVPNKGAMVWRLLDHTLGRETFIAAVRGVLESSKGTLAGLTFSSLRSVLAERGGDRIKALLEQQFDQVTDLDLMIGLPQQRGAEWVSALRNTGATEVVTTAKAVTATGEQLSVPVSVPSKNFGEALFKTTAKIVRVEIDPDKLYPQLDYANDRAPRSRDFQESVAEAVRLFGAQDFVKAEAIGRELLVSSPHSQEAQVILARALLAQNKMDEAEKFFRLTLAEALPTPSSLAWSNIGLGEIAMKKAQPAEAVKRFNDAVRADAEYASSLAARAGRIRAETEANSIAVDGAVRTFVSQLDQAIISGKKAELEQKIVSGELVRFIGGVVGTQPEVWQTRVLRTEQLDANTVIADVTINARELGKEQSGTAVLIIARKDGGWQLAGIDLFEVR